MKILFEKVHHKINGLIWSLFSSGVLFLLMAILSVYDVMVIRLIFALSALIISYIFIYSALRLWHLKKDIKNHFNL